jgi:hypothetical protein
MEYQNLINAIIKTKSDNILIDIIKSSEKLKQSDISKIFKFIFKKKVVTDKKVINNALIYSVSNGLYIITDSLLKYGKANPNLKTSSGYSILDEACDNYFIKTAQVLLKYGGKGFIWCTNKKDCKKYIKQYMEFNQDMENI